LDIIYTQILFTKAPSIPNTNWPRKEQQWPPANPIQNLPTKNKNQGQQKKSITNLEDSSQNVKPCGPPDGAVGALCFSHNISPCHGLRLLQVPAGPYLSRGRGVGILPKGFGVRFLGFEDGHDVCADFFFLGEVVVWCDFVGWGW